MLKIIFLAFAGILVAFGQVQQYPNQNPFAFPGVAVIPPGTTGAITIGSTVMLTSTTGPVIDPGGAIGYQFNGASGALTFNAPVAVAGMRRCYRNATGKSGAITVQLASTDKADLAGSNGSTGGTIVSGGALADEICLTSDVANHWYARGSSGTWTSN